MRRTWNAVEASAELEELGIHAPCLVVWDTDLDPEVFSIARVTPNHGRLLALEMDGKITPCDLTDHRLADASLASSSEAPPPPERVRLSVVK